MFHQLTIKNITKETSEASSFEFEIPAHLKNEFIFKPGQFLTLKAEINGEDVRRSYSICSTPKSEILKVVVKRIPKGKFSTYATKTLKIGDQLEVAIPTGTFSLESQSTNSKKYVLIAAGSGITPIISILKTALEEESDSSVDLYYGNTTAVNTIFKSELDNLKNAYGERLNIHYIYSREKGESRFHSGRLEGRKLKKIFKKFSPISQVNEVFICGPQNMTIAIQKLLKEKLKFPSTNVHFELFTANVVQKEIPLSKGKSSITAIIDGKEVQFEAEKNESILEAGLRAGNDIPFSCQGGVCGACKCIIVDGDTEMGMNLALSEDEVQSGYSLACQTVSKSAKTKVSFDF